MSTVLEGLKEGITDFGLFLLTTIAGLFSLAWTIVTTTLQFVIATTISFAALFSPRLREWWKTQVLLAAKRKLLIDIISRMPPDETDR